MDIILYILLAFMILLGLSSILVLFVSIYEKFYRKMLRYESFTSPAEVSRKEHKVTYTTTGVGKTTIHQEHNYNEEYNIYVHTDDGEEYCIDDMKLYYSTKVGDKVRVNVTKGYNKRNKMKYKCVSLEKKSVPLQ